MSSDDPFRFIRDVDLRRLLEAARPRPSEVDERLSQARARRRHRGSAQGPRPDSATSQRERRAVENEVARERAEAARALLATFRLYEEEEARRREQGEFDLVLCSTMPPELHQFIAGAGLRILTAEDPKSALRDFLQPPIRGPRPDDARSEKLAAGAARLERHGAELDDAFHRTARVFGVGEETVRAAYYRWPARSRLIGRII